MTAYKNDVFKPHMKELLANYGPVGYIWFDGNGKSRGLTLMGEMYGFVRRLQPATLLGNRIEPSPNDPAQARFPATPRPAAAFMRHPILSGILPRARR